MRFLTQKLTNFAEYICAIRSVLKNFVEFLRLTPKSTWFLLLIDSWFIIEGTNFRQLSSNLFFETFAKNIKLFLKNRLQRISQERHFISCRYFRIRFNENKCLVYPWKQLFVVRKVPSWMLDWVLNTPLNCQSSVFPSYNDQPTNVLN